jgi:protein LTV1
MLEAQEAIPSELQGFQPEMNPHLRQTLEALDDDAFVQEGADDDFFAGLMEGGERDDNQEEEFDFEEDGADADTCHLPKDSEDCFGRRRWSGLARSFRQIQEGTESQDRGRFSS